MAELHKSYLNNDNIRLVSITVNPEYDSTQVMSRYAQHFKADIRKWFFLTGNREAIQQLALQGFKLAGGEALITHSTYFVLVDFKGEIRGYYDGLSPEALQKLNRDISRLTG